MPTIHKSVLAPYSAEQMYLLVNDIADYPAFLPWCSASQILAQSEDEICASLTLAKGGIQKSFTTCNRLQKNKMIEVRLQNGPFRHLQGFWQFEPISEAACRITFNLEFEFSNRLLGLAFGPIFQQATQTLIDAFTERAQQIYG